MRLRLLLAAAAFAWAGCRLYDGVAAGGSVSEETNGSLVGRVAYPDGSPAAGASVIVRPREFLRDTAPSAPLVELDAVTDKDGFYRVGALVPGPYVVEVRDGRAQAMLDAGDVLPGLGLDLDLDTLRPTGALEGRLETDSGSRQAGFVQIYGLDRLARADSAGRFSFSDLPAGRFRLRPVSSLRGRAYGEPAPVPVLSGGTSRLEIWRFASFEAEDYSLWAHSRNLYLNTAATGVLDTVTAYPLLVRLHAGNFDFAQSGGKDLRFTDMQGRRLRYQVERWDAQGRKAEVWVKLDTLWGNSRDRYITLHWGNADAPDFSNGPAVFGDYGGVWHLGRTPAAEFPDASPAAAQAKGNGPLGDKEAAIGMGVSFGGDQGIWAPGHSALRPSVQVALSAWIQTAKTDPDGGEIMSMGNNYGLRLTSRGEPYFYLFDDTLWQGTVNPPYDHWKLAVAKGLDLRDNRWHHVAATWDGVFMRIYVDGREKARASLQGRIAYAFGKDLWIGRLSGGDVTHDFSGLLDEGRVSGQAWSASRVKLDYESQKPESALLEFR